MKRFPWFEVILIVVITSISLYGAFSDGQNFSRRWFTRDDAYYYFKVAQNISEGHGSTFDGMNKTNGYHPLWLLICVPIFALARFDLILPLRILFLLMSGLSVATAILLYRMIGKVFAPAIGMLAAVYWVFSTDVLKRIYQQGLETGIAAFFLVLFVYKLYEFERSWRAKSVARKELIVLGIVGLCVVLSRLDLVFLVAIAGIWIVFRGDPLRFLLPLDIVLLAFSVLLAFLIKMPLPEYYTLADTTVKTLLVSLAVKIPLAYLFGLYQRKRLDDLFVLLRSLGLFVLTSSAILSVTMIIVARVLAFDNFPRMILVYDAILTFFGIGLMRLIFAELKTTESASIDYESPIAHFIRNWARWLSDGIFYFGVVFGGLGIYMLWNKLAFGTSSPVSGQIKRWWGSLSGRVYGGPARNTLSFFGVDYHGDSNAWHPVSDILGNWAEHLYRVRILDTWRYVIILTLFAMLFYVLLLFNKRKAKAAITQMAVIPLLCGSWLQIFYYHVLGYSAYKEWYWISQLILIVIVLSIIAGLLYQRVRKTRYVQTTVQALAVVVGVYMGLNYWSVIRGTMEYNVWSADEPHMELATFLEQNTEPGSIIGLTGGGNVSYFIDDRVIINMDGLINSYAYFELLQKKEAGKYLAEEGMNYVMANLNILDGLPYRGQYNDYMELMDARYGGKRLVRYHPMILP